MKRTWEVVHDCDGEDGEPTCWVSVINHSKYGKYVWISQNSKEQFDVEVSYHSDTVASIMQCKSLISAKRWVSMNI